MINFFRKTRKKLADDNKPMKYLRYAIGEIVLVVIGILIALSINNWNEGRKEIVIEQNYLERLLIDLQKDINGLSFSKESSKNHINQIKLLTNAITNPDLSNHSPTQILESIEKLTWTAFLPISRFVYDELNSTGRMALIGSEELREQLAAYYGEIEHWEKELESIEFRKQFANETAGLLNIEILTAIQDTESLFKTKGSQKLNLDVDITEVKKIVKELASNPNAIKWLPQIYHYHILATKIIDQLILQCESLIKAIELQLK